MLKFYQETIWVSWQAGSLHSWCKKEKWGHRSPGVVSLRAVLPGILPMMQVALVLLWVPKRWAGKMHSSRSLPPRQHSQDMSEDSFPTHCGSQISCRLSTSHPRKWHRNTLVTILTQYFPLHRWILESDTSLEITLSFLCVSLLGNDPTRHSRQQLRRHTFSEMPGC